MTTSVIIAFLMFATFAVNLVWLVYIFVRRSPSPCSTIEARNDVTLCLSSSSLNTNITYSSYSSSMVTECFVSAQGIVITSHVLSVAISQQTRRAILHGMNMPQNRMCPIIGSACQLGRSIYNY
jgi:hypothetical protein